MKKYENSQDRELITLFKQGESEAMGMLVKRHAGSIKASIVMLVKDSDLANDLLQDTFIKAIDSLIAGNYREENNFKSWVMRISYNLCMDYFRKSGNPYNTKVVFKDVPENFLEDVKSNNEINTISKQSSVIVRSLIDKLSPEQREVVVLRHYANLHFKEIASLIGISTNTCLGRMRYALINLRKLKAGTGL